VTKRGKYTSLLQSIINDWYFFVAQLPFLSPGRFDVDAHFWYFLRLAQDAKPVKELRLIKLIPWLYSI